METYNINVFISGAQGAGKTTLFEPFTDWMKEHLEKRAGVTVLNEKTLILPNNDECKRLHTKEFDINFECDQINDYNTKKLGANQNYLYVDIFCTIPSENEYHIFWENVLYTQIYHYLMQEGYRWIPKGDFTSFFIDDYHMIEVERTNYQLNSDMDPDAYGKLPNLIGKEDLNA